MTPGEVTAEIAALAEAHLSSHRAFLEQAKSRAHQLTDRTPAAMVDSLRNMRDLLVLLADTRLISYEKWDTADVGQHGAFSDHPHWAMAFSILIDELYPQATFHLAETILAPYIPANLSHELVRRGLWDPDQQPEPPCPLPSQSLLLEMIGETPVSLDAYVHGLQHDLFLLRGQYDDELARDTPPFTHYRPISPLPAQRAVYHVASTLGVGKALRYLELLWGDGWLHNAFLYAHLWLGLTVRSRLAGNDSLSLGGWQRFLSEVQDCVYTADLDGPLVVDIARTTLALARDRVRAARREARDLDDWIRRIHPQLLPISGVSALRALADRLSLAEPLRDDLTRTWRYAAELHADIELFIQNPFGLPLAKLNHSLRRIVGEDVRRRELLFWSRGRTLLPDTVLEEATYLAEVESSRLAGDDERGQILSALLLDRMGPRLRAAYEASCYLTMREFVVADAPCGDIGSALAHSGPGRMSEQARLVATAFLLWRIWHRAGQPENAPLNYRVDLGHGLTMVGRSANGSPTHLRLSAGAARERMPADVEALSPEPRDRVLSAMQRRFLKLLRAVYDVLRALDILRRCPRYDPATMVQLAAERDGEPYGFVIDFAEGEPETLTIVPRGLIADTGPRVATSLYSTLSGVVATCALLEMRSRHRGRLDSVEVRCAMIMDDEHAFQVSFGTGASLRSGEHGAE